MSVTKSSQPELSDLIEKSHIIGERAIREVRTAEKNGHLSDELAQDINDARLIQILQPARHGGLEMGFPELIEVGMVIGQYDMSAAWIANILAIHHWWGALTSPQLQEEIWGDNPHRLFADAFAPLGTGEKVEGGYLVTGQWPFASGILWSEWYAGGTLVHTSDGQPPQYLMCFVPKSDYTVLNDWDTVGMRGTGSCSVAVDKVFVPEYRAFDLGAIMAGAPLPGIEYNPGVIFQVPIVSGLAISLMPPVMGGALGALEVFKTRMANRTPTFTNQVQNQLATQHALLAESSVRLDFAQQMLRCNAEELMTVGTSVARGEVVDTDQFRMRVAGWRAQIGKECRSVTAELFQNAGAGAIYMDSPLQRFWRDTHAVAQHVVMNHDTIMRSYGLALAGQEMQPALI
jgi:3-hydroxy-9,10-secoandrosta-1,3,5(10)-triene-9,17-dione monooxygenase